MFRAARPKGVCGLPCVGFPTPRSPVGKWMEIVILAVLIGLIPASIAAIKGRSFLLWWLYGAAIFIVALPHSIIAKPSGRKRRCPHCTGTVRIEASVCPHCHRDLEIKKCACGAPISPDATRCARCSGWA